MPARNNTRISRKIPLIIGAFGFCIALLVGVLVPRQIENFMEEAALRDALTNVSQIKELRGYYTSAVVSVVKTIGALEPHYDHHGDDSRIPLPATMIHELSSRFSQDGRESI